MKIKMFVLVLLPLLILTLAGVSQAWQGRMGGMGDPYGLLADESDFLIFPAKIAGGEGIRLYGGYRFTYRGVTAWNYDLDWFAPTGPYIGSREYDASGEELRHDALVVIAMPLGVGSMGIFFEYAGAQGDYDGDGYWITPALPNTYDLTSDLDDFTFSLLYGLPVGSFQLGGEFQFAYRDEENRTEYQDILATDYFINNPQGGYAVIGWPFDNNLFPYMIPYDSSYMEALFKGSLQGTLGPVDVECALRGGFIFGGDNQLRYLFSVGGTPVWGADIDGKVEGWQIGGDLWVRYLLTDDLSLPFLVRLDYQTKTRDGDDVGLLSWSYGYESEENELVLEAGGGVDKELAAGTRIAAGIYYSYHDIKNDFSYQIPTVFWTLDNSKCPYLTEHRATLRLAGEFELSPMATVRIGLTPFFGWVREDFEYIDTGFFGNSDNISLDGYRWGIGASFGGSLRFNGFTMEPFVSGGYQEYDLSGDGGTTAGGALAILTEMDLTRHEWYIGGGISFLLDL
jgi:hypothetical protein